MTNIKKKYHKYIDGHINQYNNILFMSYEEWLEDLCNKLKDENSLLCPAGDFDVITTLKTEKIMYMEEISRLEKFIEQKDKAFETLMDHARMIEYERDNLKKVLRLVGVDEEQENKLMLEVQQADIEG